MFVDAVLGVSALVRVVSARCSMPVSASVLSVHDRVCGCACRCCLVDNLVCQFVCRCCGSVLRRHM